MSAVLDVPVVGVPEWWQSSEYFDVVYAVRPLFDAKHVGLCEPRVGTSPLRPLTSETSLGFEVIEFAENMLVSYPIVLGDKKTTDQFGRIRGLPTTLIYDPKGKLVKTHLGAITRSQIEALIAAGK